MEKTIEIPKGYEARIEGNKVILEPKESEDERIRKEIIFLLKHYNSEEELTTEHSIESMIAYLEKQKEQEQPEPELDIDTLREWSMRYAPDIRPAIESTAYHFWNMALNARK